MTLLKKVLANLEEVICNLLFIGMTFAIGCQVMLRSMGLPLAWTEEVSRYMFVALTYIGSVLAIKHRRHLKVDAVLMLFDKQGQFILNIISNLLFIVFVVLLGYHSTNIVIDFAFGFGQRAPATGLPMAIPYGSVALGMWMMAGRLVQDIILLVREYRDASIQHEADEVTTWLG